MYTYDYICIYIYNVYMCNLNIPNQYEPNQLGLLICPEKEIKTKHVDWALY